MKSLKDILAIVVGIIAAIGAIYYFYKFVTFPDPAGGHALESSELSRTVLDLDIVGRRVR